ncbi:hypothetical protein hamaS1_00940 [Moorella sp. Hama-1]|nr:hypothetical protein hamaS1_00940 [Moorella sp. Hama-1]
MLVVNEQAFNAPQLVTIGQANHRHAHEFFTGIIHLPHLPAYTCLFSRGKVYAANKQAKLKTKLKK